MLNGEELSSAYASADIFMMPSESETLGFVALEAMASGLAVVSVAAGGLVDIITKPGVIGESCRSALDREGHYGEVGGSLVSPMAQILLIVGAECVKEVSGHLH